MQLRSLALSAKLALATLLIALAPSSGSSASPASPASPAGAEQRATTWETVAKVKGAKSQACWRRDGSTYVVRARHSGREASKVSRSKFAFKALTDFWSEPSRTTWVKPGKVSDYTDYGFTQEGFEAGKIRATALLKTGAKRTDKQQMSALPRC